MSLLSFQGIKTQLKTACDVAQQDTLRAQLNPDTVTFSKQILPPNIHTICTHHVNSTTFELQKAGRSKVYNVAMDSRGKLLAHKHFHAILSLMRDASSTATIKQELKSNWKKFLILPCASDIPDRFKQAIRENLSDAHKTLTQSEQDKLSALKQSDLWEWLTCITLIAISQPKTDDRLRKSWILAQPQDTVIEDPLEALLQQGISEYQAGNGVEACKTLTSYLGNKGILHKDEANLYLGKSCSLYDVVDFEGAEKAFKKISSGTFAGEARYLRYRLYQDGHLPPDNDEDGRDTNALKKRLLAEADKLGCLYAKKDRAELFFDKADQVGHIQNSTNLKEAVRLYTEIFNCEEKNHSNDLTSFVAYRLYQCSLMPNSGITPNQARNYLRIAADGGNQDALQLERRKSPMELMSFPKSVPSEQITMQCIFNSVNAKSLYLAMTLPATCDRLCLCNETNDVMCLRMKNTGCRFVGEQLPESCITQNKKLIFALLSDDFDKNRLDALYILNAIKTFSLPVKAEVYLRGHAEYLAPLVDTMLRIMQDKAIPVHILDDDNDSALSLLAELPLFFPIRSMNDSEQRTLHFVVLGDNRCAEYLVRHAFWMMNFHNKNITTKITVLAPHALQLKNHLCGVCAGMFDDSIKQWLSCPRLQFEALSYDGIELERYLDSIADDSCYIAIAGDNESENLSLALRVREWTVRTKLSAAQNTVVAFQCAGAESAFLSRQTVVQSLPYGTPWYSTYALTPFASDSRYSWSALSASPLELMSRCIHMAYSGLSPDAEPTDKANALKKDYFTCYYNHASSYAVAAGLVYRLFSIRTCGSCCLPLELQKVSQQDMMEQLYLPDMAKKMAQGFERYLPNKSAPTLLTQILAEQEHDRWCAYMLATGWRRATIEQMEHYLTATQKHQLYAGKLHPCICPYEELENVARARYDTLKTVKPDAKYDDLMSYDFSIICKTGDILRLAWSPAAVE